MTAVELPLNINNAYATYESQFGFVQRPTHKNTTLDAAKFEVCGHKVRICFSISRFSFKLRGLSMNYQFADLSEYGYGVAFLSESKYGFACEGNVLHISLLRAATAPDAEQDQGLILACRRVNPFSHALLGRHEFSWAVMPHVGSFLESDVPMAALIYNSPLHGQLGFSDASALISLIISLVRTVPGQNASHIAPPLPFWLEGAPISFWRPSREEKTTLNRMIPAQPLSCACTKRLVGTVLSSCMSENTCL
jgi:alpha-mannosidase